MYTCILDVLHIYLIYFYMNVRDYINEHRVLVIYTEKRN